MQYLKTMALCSACLAISSPAAASYADDRAEIENLMATYIIALDARDAETYASSFTEDGVLVYAGGTATGREELKQVLPVIDQSLLPVVAPERGSVRPRARHMITNMKILVDGDTAKFFGYWTAVSNNTPDGKPKVLYFGHYEDQLVRQKGKWLIKRKELYNENSPRILPYYPNLGEPAR